uniref:Integral membrane protein n=1 Tax=Tetraselmis sp. GSL018 TaxID=582737 RepID=A0A061QX12_9CHLO
MHLSLTTALSPPHTCRKTTPQIVTSNSYARLFIPTPCRKRFALKPAQRRTDARAAFEEKPTYKGVYGEWRIEEEDVKEVTAYRVGISAATLSLLVCSTAAFLPEDSETTKRVVQFLDFASFFGIVSLGLSLKLIHVYVAPLKRFLQLLWAFGATGTVAIMATQEEPAAQYVFQHPMSVLAVGPVFAAVSGLAFKEGLCYGKPEAAGLFFVVPALLLGHLFGIIPEEGEKALLAVFCVLSAVFAGRKYTQPIKDDIGDKSIFEFQALPEEEQLIRLRELEIAASAQQSREGEQ